MRSKVTGMAMAVAAAATLVAAPAAHASCPEEPCNAPNPQPGEQILCVVTYDGPIKEIDSCFDPRP